MSVTIHWTAKSPSVIATSAVSWKSNATAIVTAGGAYSGSARS